MNNALKHHNQLARHGSQSDQSNHTGDSVSSFRLFQLISPSLPIGGFTYSQGLEWAVEAEWVNNQSSMVDWLTMMLNYSIVTLELPIMKRLYAAVADNDMSAIAHWSEYLYSCRETKELRAEELQRGKALYTLLKQLNFKSISLLDEARQDTNHRSNSLLGFCLAAHEWGIPLHELERGYVWSWAENMVMAGVKLVPLGQTAGQLSLIELSNQFPQALLAALDVQDDEIGSFTPSIAIASSRHETQYTRLFRS